MPVSTSSSSRSGSDDDARTAGPYQHPRLTMAYGSFVIQQDLASTSNEAIFCHHGGSGCGKSTLLRHIRWDWRPPPVTSSTTGRVSSGRQPRDRSHAPALGYYLPVRRAVQRHDPGENNGPAATAVHALRPGEIADIKWPMLALVGLAGSSSTIPPKISGGMLKRAAWPGNRAGSDPFSTNLRRPRPISSRL